MIGTSQLINTFSRPCFTDTTDIFKDGSGVALYGLDYDASDAGGASGKFGEAAIFNGSSSYIELPLNTGSFFAGKNNLTVSLWFKTNGSVSANSVLFADYNNESYNMFSRLDSSGNLYVANRFNLGTNSTTGSVAYDDSNWHHLVITNDVSSLTQSVYVDGSVVFTNSMSSNSWSSTATGRVSLGANYSTSGSAYANFLDGSLDQVRIYDTALTSSQVTQLYQENNSTVGTHLFGCIANYNLDGSAKESMGTTAYDGTETDITYRYDGTPTAIDFGVGGKSNYGARFNGSSSYIDLGTSLLGSKSTFSVSAWVNFDNLNTQNFIFYNSESGTGGNVGFYDFGNGSIYFQPDASTSANRGYISNSGIYTTDEWVHIIMVFDGSATGNSNRLKAYIQGTERTLTYDGTIPSSTGTSTASSWIGGRASTKFSGDIDQVRVFNKALSSAEVSKLYGNGAGEIACAYTATTTNVNYPVTNTAYYKLDNSAIDETGSYNGTETNIEYRFGRFGQAAVFNGSSSSINVNNTVSTALTFTASLWVNGADMNKNSSDPNQIQTIFYNRNPYIVISQFSGNWDFTIKNSSSQNTTISYATSNFNNNEWYNIVISCNGVGGQMNYYVNGQSVGTNTAPSSTINVASTGFIGSGDGGQYFNGKIDQVRIFSTAFSASQVTELYNEKPEVDTSNFKAVLYEGNSSTQYISNVGFTPDLVWIKRRTTTATDHVLMDTVREQYLISNKTNAQASYGSVFDFNYLGFDLNGNSSSFNLSGDDYVAWCWKAGGLLNKSASFNGSSSYIDTGISSLGANFSVSMWINEDALDSGGFFGNWNATSNDDMFWRTASDGSLRINIDGTSNQNFGSAGDVTINNWHHIAVSFNSGTYEVYLDSNSLGTATTSNTVFNSGANFYIGDDNSATYFDGSIDQVRIFNKAISSSEVTSLYNETASTINTLQVLGDTSCIAAYPLGTGAGDIGNTYSATPTNVTFNNPGHLTRNTNGTIESTVSANTAAGFSIVKFAGGNSSGTTVGHGLTQPIELLIVKNLNDGTDQWITWHKDVEQNSTSSSTFTLKGGSILLLNSTSATIPSYSYDGQMGSISGENLIAYCFHSVAGYSKMGSYTGNGTSASSTKTITTDFQPRWIMFKCTSVADYWIIFDSLRGNVANVTDTYLLANLSQAEADLNNGDSVEFLSNGFKITGDGRYFNQNLETYIYMAFK